MNKYITLGLFILLGLLISSGAYIGHLQSKLHDTAKGRDAAIADYHTVSEKYINAQGDIVTKTEAFELSRNEFKKALEANDLQWVKKFKDYKRTQSASSFTTQFQPKEKVIVRTIYVPCKDSIKAWQYKYIDSYNTIEATVLDTPRVEIRDRYYVVITRSRPKHWLVKFQWSRWNFHGQVTNLNRLIKVDSVQTLFVK